MESKLELLLEEIKQRYKTENQLNSVYVFFKPDGNHHVFIKRSLKKAEIPKEFRFQDLRHTFASDLARLGTNQKLLQELLHQNDQRSNQRYIHFTSDPKRKAIMELEKEYQGLLQDSVVEA